MKESKSKYLLTTIIPMYNSAEYVYHTLNVVVQSFGKYRDQIQVILVDDGSTDETKEIAQEFCTKYNDATRDKMGDILPVEITVYDDRSFGFVIKTPPTAFLIKKVAKLKKGSSKGANESVGTLTQSQLKEIAEIKLPDLNCYTVEEAMKIVAGTAKNMGVTVEE